MPSLNLQTMVGLSMLRESIKNFIFIVVLLGATGASQADERISPKTNYPEVAAAINATMRTYHYNPEELDTPEYLRIGSQFVVTQ